MSVHTRVAVGFGLAGAVLIASASALPRTAEQQAVDAFFPTSDRCLACHKGITTSTGVCPPSSS